jgi:hypothetical protein
MRQIYAGCASHPRIRRKCCAHLPREERATRDYWTPLSYSNGKYLRYTFVQNIVN